MEISLEGIPCMPSISDTDLNKLILSNAVKRIDNKYFVVFKHQIIEFTVLSNGSFWVNHVQKVPCARYRIPEILPGMNQAQRTAVYVEMEHLVRHKPLSRNNFDIYGKCETLLCG